MQIHLDLDGEGGISGNTRGSHSPHRGVDGLQVRNRRSIVTPGSTAGSLSFSPRTFLVGDSPGGGERSGSDRSPASNGFASSDGHRADSDSENDSDNDSGKDSWLLTYKYFRNQNREAARKEHVSIASSASKNDAASSDGYRADFDLEADPWLLTYNFLDSLNDQDSVLQPKPVHKEAQTIRDGRSLRRKHNNEDMRSQWAQLNNDDAGMPPTLHPQANNKLQDPAPKDILVPPAQHSRNPHQAVPPMPPLSNPLPSKYFPKPETHLSHQGSGSRYPPPNLRIGVPAVKTPLADPEPPTPLPTMQKFEAMPISDRFEERGVVVDWDEPREDPFEIPDQLNLNLEDQRPNTAPNGGSVNRISSKRRYSAYAQRAAIQFAIEPPPPLVNRFPTILRSGQDSPYFNAHLNFSFDPPYSSSPRLSTLSNSLAHPTPNSQVTVPQSSSSSLPPPPPPQTTTAPSRSPPHDLATFTFPFEISHSPSLEEKIDEEYEAALRRWSGDVLGRRVRRSREVRECIRRLRECTEFAGNGFGIDF